MPWKKGQSGNPKGKPPVVKEVVELARKHTVEAIQALVDIVTDPGEKGAARVRAAEVILDRGWGKATAPIEVSGPDQQPIEWRHARDELTSLLSSLAARRAKKPDPTGTDSGSNSAA